MSRSPKSPARRALPPKHASDMEPEPLRGPSLYGDLLNAIAKVEDQLWINFGCCHRRGIVCDAVIGVVAKWVGVRSIRRMLKPPAPVPPRSRKGGSRG